MNTPRFLRRRTAIDPSTRTELTEQQLKLQSYATDVDKQLRQWPPRRIASWALMILAVVVAAQHLIAHAGERPLPLTMGWQDLLVGYPTAAVLAIAGLIVLDPRPRV